MFTIRMGRFLNAYRGADGIKTGFTNAAGFNLVGSARRGNERIIASLFGGKSVRWRNARMAELLDMGFARAPSRAREIKPQPLDYVGNPKLVAQAKRKPKRLPTAIAKAYRPIGRPGGVSTNVEALVARAVQDGEIAAAVKQTVQETINRNRKTAIAKAGASAC